MKTDSRFHEERGEKRAMTEIKIIKRVILGFMAICFTVGCILSAGATQVKAADSYFTETEILNDVWIHKAWAEDTPADYANPISDVRMDNVLLDSTQYRIEYTDMRPSGTNTQVWILYLKSSFLQSLNKNQEYTFSWFNSTENRTISRIYAIEADSIASQGSACDHEYEWVDDVEATADSDAKMVYKCRKCGQIDMRMTEANSAYLKFNQDTEKKIKDAPNGATVKVDTTRWNSFYRSVIDALSERTDETLVIEYTDKGERRQITIPAGCDLTGFINDDGYTGFEFLAGKGLETDYWKDRLTK